MQHPGKHIKLHKKEKKIKRNHSLSCLNNFKQVANLKTKYLTWNHREYQQEAQGTCNWEFPQPVLGPEYLVMIIISGIRQNIGIKLISKHSAHRRSKVI
jgi:hypothetical protein